jgi:hypothetical protein
MNTTTFPAPQRLDRVVICAPNAGDLYGQSGVLITYNERQTCLVRPDSNPRVEAAVFLKHLVNERYKGQLNLPPIAEAKAKAEAERPAPVEVVRTPVKAVSSPGKRGKPKKTATVTQELGDAAIALYKTGKGMVAIAAEMNFNPAELSAYFKSQGIELKKGRKAK